jgi:hypothetical protein
MQIYRGSTRMRVNQKFCGACSDRYCSGCSADRIFRTPNNQFGSGVTRYGKKLNRYKAF